MIHLLPLLLGCGNIDRRQLETGLNIALQVRAKTLKLAQALVLLADHPESTPSLVGVSPVLDVKLDLLNLRTGSTKAKCRATTDVVDFGIDANPRNVCNVSDTQAFCIGPALNLGQRTLPWRRDRNRRQATEADDRVEHQCGIFGVSRQRTVHLARIP